jgi:hypothetical protein
LDIFDQRDLEGAIPFELLDDARYLADAGDSCGPPTPFSYDDLKALSVGSYDDRLDQAVDAKRLRKFIEGLIPKDLPRLVRVRVDPVERDTSNPVLRERLGLNNGRHRFRAG